MRLLTAFVSGLVFGLGLLLSGMANPAKVLGFLDLAGRWDPSLVLVMLGAIAVAAPAFAFAKRQQVSWLGDSIVLPRARHIDLRLVGGGTLFGVGWGLAGLCPGPGLLVMAMGHPQVWVFGLAMLAGMVVFELLERVRLATGKGR